MLLYCVFFSVTIGLMLPAGYCQAGTEFICAGVRYPWRRNYECCGRRLYNRYTEVCCEDGQVVARHHSHGTACCGAVAFDSRWQSCCAGHVIYGAGLGCCGMKPYSKRNATCCQGVLSMGLSGLLSQCCSTQAYNPRDRICCEGRLWPRQTGLQCCGPELHNSSSQFCVQSKILAEPRKGPHHLLCGEKQYDSRTQTCCSLYRNPTPNPPGLGCCGSPGNVVHYNLSTAWCCREKVQHQVCDTQKKCQTPYGLQSYSSPSMECLNGDVVPHEYVRKCGEAYYDSRALTCCDGYLLFLVPGWTCCGKALFNHTSQSCNGEIREQSDVRRTLRMCGWNSHYEPSSQRCCLNASHYGQSYTAGYTCCNGTVDPTPGTSLYGGQCCDGKGYNPDTQFCCSGQIMNHEGWQRIGENSFLEETLQSICCAGEHFHVSSGETACHGTIPYNPRTEVVCEGMVHAVGMGHCCGESVYNPETHVCCSGYSHPRPNVSDNSTWLECCGTQPYDTADPGLRCCSNRLHRLPHDLLGVSHRCCGDDLINTHTHGCCSSEGQQVEYLLGTDTACCGHMPYNTSAESCCQGRLHLGRPQQKIVECTVISVKDIDLQAACNHSVLLGQLVGVVAAGGYLEYTVRKWPETWTSGTREQFKTQDASVEIRLHACSCPTLTPLQDYAFWVSRGQEGHTKTLTSQLVSPLYLASDVSYLSRLLAKCQH
ncbi:hypothetical protein MATL_G00043630 [Megalops atlanticus]|uniref:Galaxin-like repeats domain-containing protein n=1 Tax=Megalops atlanticus TaxID=7932 RepID=A0A9D3Q975_MEGAT|nr:hypothetical protein MATL_G00043630 [Megalops atlanticus]